MEQVSGQNPPSPHVNKFLILRNITSICENGTTPNFDEAAT